MLAKLMRNLLNRGIPLGNKQCIPFHFPIARCQAMAAAHKKEASSSYTHPLVAIHNG